MPGVHPGSTDPTTTRFALKISFEDDGGAASETVTGTLRTAPGAGSTDGKRRTGGDLPPSSAQTFGPEVVFAKAGRFPGESPRDGENQFFGHVQLDEDGTFTASIRNVNGAVVFSNVLTS